MQISQMVSQTELALLEQSKRMVSAQAPYQNHQYMPPQYGTNDQMAYNGTTYTQI